MAVLQSLLFVLHGQRHAHIDEAEGDVQVHRCLAYDAYVPHVMMYVVMLCVVMMFVVMIGGVMLCVV
jgi:hypothetical protein